MPPRAFKGSRTIVGMRPEGDGDGVFGAGGKRRTRRIRLNSEGHGPSSLPPFESSEYGEKPRRQHPREARIRIGCIGKLPSFSTSGRTKSTPSLSASSMPKIKARCADLWNRCAGQRLTPRRTRSSHRDPWAASRVRSACGSSPRSVLDEQWHDDTRQLCAAESVL
jgi:hypothetical protein